MSSSTLMSAPPARAMSNVAFERFGAACAILTGVATLLYSVAFVVLRNPLMAGLFQLIGAILTTAVLVQLYLTLRDVDSGFSLWGTALGFIGMAGSAIHGGYDMASALSPPAANAALTNLSSQTDPRGLLTFGVTGLAIFVLAGLMRRSRAFPSGLSYLGYVLATLLVVLYLARLIVVDAANPSVLVPALVTGFLVNPAWYIWLGLTWRRRAGG